MDTITATGVSTETRPGDAAKQAVAQAIGGLGGARVDFGFVFAGPGHDLKTALDVAKQATDCSRLIGCSTAGELTERGLVHGGVAVMLVASSASVQVCAFRPNLKTEHAGAATALVTAYSTLRSSAFADGLRRSTTVLLTDGLAGTGEELVHALAHELPPGVQVVGGAAGDEAQFEKTVVGTPEQSGPNAVAAMHVFGRRPWGVGVDHGLKATTRPMRVTRAEGNVVFELEHQPAFEVYRRHAAERGVTLTPEGAGKYLIGNELGIQVFDRLSRARAPLSVGSDGSLTCAAAIPQGASVTILDGEPDSMVEAARAAAHEARESLGGEAAGVLLFDCVCRGMILGDQFGREIEAVRSVFGDVPVAGFLTYGEIARYPGQFSGWHNATAVVAAIPR